MFQNLEDIELDVEGQKDKLLSQH